MLKYEFKVEAIIMFVKSIKKGIKWYIHFIQKPVILFAINLPFFLPFLYALVKPQAYVCFFFSSKFGNIFTDL